MRQHLLTLALFLLLPLCLASKEENSSSKDILVLCSHSESSEWAQDMLLPVRDFDLDREDVSLKEYFLRMTAFSSPEDLKARETEIFDEIADRPSLVVIIGGSGYGLAEDVNRRWPGIPMIMAGENDYYCNRDYIIRGTAEPGATRYPMTGMRDKGANITLLHTPAMVGQTIDLMFTVQPWIQKFLFVGGENFQSREQQLRVERYLAERYPQVEYRPVLSTEYTTDGLIDLLKNESGPEVGVFFSSWLIHEGYVETLSSRQNVAHIMESLAPVFTMFKCDLDKYADIVGYYSYDHIQYYRILKQRIAAVLDNGIEPRSMPFMHFEVGAPALNWRAMKEYGLDTKAIPEDAELHNGPHTLWKEHKKTIMWAALFLLLAIGGFIFVVMTRSLKTLRKSNAIAENANTMKTAFVQNISHEIRTPLNAIIGFSQLLCLPDGYNTEEEKGEYLEYVMNNSNLLTVIVNDMLSLSDMENGKYVINKTPSNLNAMCRMAIKSVEHRILPDVKMLRKKGIPEDFLVNTDGLRVQQVLVNFLTNACKHTTEGSITLESSLTEIPGFVTFSVADTGTGVPPEKAEEIFDRFVKLDTNLQGAGLGLSICKRIAANLGGDVWLDTSYTDGARFVFTVPLEEKSV